MSPVVLAGSGAAAHRGRFHGHDERQHRRAHSGDSGERYLPKAARDSLSDADYRRTTARKRRDTKQGRQYSAQPQDVADKAARARREGPTKAALLAEARRRKIAGRSKMTKAGLAAALAR